MQAAATPSPSDRLVFANQLAEVRAMDANGQYKEQLNELEVEYQFILSLTLTRSLSQRDASSQLARKASRHQGAALRYSSI